MFMDMPAATSAQYLAALLYPQEMVQCCPNLSDFVALPNSSHLPMSHMAEIRALAEVFQIDTKTRQEMRELTAEIAKVRQESQRRADERDRAKEALAKARAKVKKLQEKLVEASAFWLKRLFSCKS
jgi:hypothetical protein